MERYMIVEIQYLRKLMKNEFEKLKNQILNFTNKTNIRDRLVYFKKRVKLDTKLNKSSFFLNSKLCLNIVAATNFLPENVPMYFRIKCILKNITKLEKCQICGKDRALLFSKKFKDPIQKTTCGNVTCIAKLAGSQHKMTSDEKMLHKNIMCKQKQDIVKYAKQLLIKYETRKFNLIDRKTLEEKIKNLLKTCNSFKNIAFIKDKMYVNEIDFLCSIIDMTSFIEIDKNNFKCRSFRWAERLYCILNNLKTKQICKFCGCESKFISFYQGYSDTCKKCSGQKIREVMNGMPLSDIRKQINENKYEILNFPTNTTRQPLIVKCKKCHHISKVWLYNGISKKISQLNLCKHCKAKDRTSKEENELFDFVQSLLPNELIFRNDRTIINPLELDIVIPSRKLAIEFDGIYWHNDQHIANNYHLQKTILCNKAGYKLIHIFENEWLSDKKIVKSILIDKLKCSLKETIDANKCSIYEVKNEYEKLKCQTFINENSLIKNENFDIALCMKFENYIVATMTFCELTNDIFKIIDFCIKSDLNIKEGFESFLKYFEKNFNPKKLYASINRRYSIGNQFLSTSFKLIETTLPKCSYFIYNKKQKIFNSLKTQTNNCHTIYDCGNLVFEKTYEK